MDIHKNARLTIWSRELLAKRVLLEKVTLNTAAAEFNVSAKTAAKWVCRYQAEGVGGLRDHSSRPHRLRAVTTEAVVERVAALHLERWAGCRIARPSHRVTGNRRDQVAASAGSTCTSPSTTTPASLSCVSL
jgi:transposase